MLDSRWVLIGVPILQIRVHVDGPQIGSIPLSMMDVDVWAGSGGQQ